jgi:hypothetical protein
MFGYHSYSCGNFVPVFDSPDVGKKVFQKLDESAIPNLKYVSVYDGTILESRPTYNTLTHDPSGKHKYFHLAKIGWSESLNEKVIFCHQNGSNGSQSNVYRDSTGRRQRY